MKKSVKRTGKALVLGSGGLLGAYGAGAAATLCKRLGPDYFDAIYGCSVGGYAASFYAAGQPDIIEEVWREHCHGRLLVNPFNVLKRESILDLDYMISLFRKPPFLLDTKAILASPVKLYFTITDYETGEPRRFSPENEEEIFTLMRASSAIPLFHPPVFFRGRKFLDGSIVDPVPVEQAAEDGNGYILVVCNRPELKLRNQHKAFLNLFSLTYKGDFKKLKLHSYECSDRIEEFLRKNNVEIIRPSEELPFKWALHSSKTRLNDAVDLGIRDALGFLKMERREVFPKSL